MPNSGDKPDHENGQPARHPHRAFRKDTVRHAPWSPEAGHSAGSGSDYCPSGRRVLSGVRRGVVAEAVDELNSWCNL